MQCEQRGFTARALVPRGLAARELPSPVAMEENASRASVLPRAGTVQQGFLTSVQALLLDLWG